MMIMMVSLLVQKLHNLKVCKLINKINKQFVKLSDTIKIIIINDNT